MGEYIESMHLDILRTTACNMIWYTIYYTSTMRNFKLRTFQHSMYQIIQYVLSYNSHFGVISVNDNLSRFDAHLHIYKQSLEDILNAKQFVTYRNNIPDTAVYIIRGQTNLTHSLSLHGNLIIFNVVREGNPCVFYRRQYGDYNESCGE